MFLLMAFGPVVRGRRTAWPAMGRSFQPPSCSHLTAIFFFVVFRSGEGELICHLYSKDVALRVHAYSKDELDDIFESYVKC